MLASTPERRVDPLTESAPAARSVTPAEARVGTIAWDKPHWRGHFYPPDLALRRRLRYAAARLRTIEIDVTFRGRPAPATFAGWRDEVPEDFRFAVKGPREVTHAPTLRDAADGAAAFLAGGVLELGARLGPLLWQFPPWRGFRPDEVEAFLAALPHSVDEARHRIARLGLATHPGIAGLPDRPLRHALEVRNPAFATPRFLDLLRRHDVAAVTTNSPGYPVFESVTADHAYLRLHGDLRRFPRGYDDAEIERLAALVRGLRDGSGVDDGRGRDVSVYLDNPDRGGIGSPFDAMRLQRLVGGPVPGTGLTVQPRLWG